MEDPGPPGVLHLMWIALIHPNKTREIPGACTQAVMNPKS